MTLKSKDVRRRARQELSQFAARVIDADTVEHSAVFESDGVRKTLFFRFGDSAHAMAGREPVIEAFVAWEKASPSLTMHIHDQGDSDGRGADIHSPSAGGAQHRR